MGRRERAVLGHRPAIGGLFTQETSWRWILWLNVIAGAIILFGVWGTRETRDEEATGHTRLRWPGASALGLGLITLALNEAPTPWPFSSAEFLLALIGGAVLLAASAPRPTRTGPARRRAPGSRATSIPTAPARLFSQCRKERGCGKDRQALDLPRGEALR